MKLDTKQYEEKMIKAVSSLSESLKGIRAGKANVAVISKVSFDYYGAPTLLTSMAEVKAADARTLVITPWDKTTLKAMEKAILASDVGITPQNDGSSIRLCFPPLTEERRKDITKQVSKYSEEAKIALRNIRRDANEYSKKQKKDGLMTEDELKNSDKSVQDLTDKYIKQVEAVTAEKNKEIMEI